MSFLKQLFAKKAIWKYILEYLFCLEIKTVNTVLKADFWLPNIKALEQT